MADARGFRLNNHVLAVDNDGDITIDTAIPYAKRDGVECLDPSNAFRIDNDVVTLTKGDGSSENITLPIQGTSVAGEDRIAISTGWAANAEQYHHPISSSVASSSTTDVASSLAVKQAYDVGNHAHPYLSNSHDMRLTLAGDVDGSVLFTNMGDATLTVSIDNDSHEHDARYYTKAQTDTAYLPSTHDTTLTLSGDASGSATFTNMGNATLNISVGNDSHTHDTRYYTKTETDTMYSDANHSHDVDYSDVNHSHDYTVGTTGITVSGTSFGIMATSQEYAGRFDSSSSVYAAIACNNTGGGNCIIASDGSNPIFKVTSTGKVECNGGYTGYNGAHTPGTSKFAAVDVSGTLSAGVVSTDFLISTGTVTGITHTDVGAAAADSSPGAFTVNGNLQVNGNIYHTGGVAQNFTGSHRVIFEEEPMIGDIVKIDDVLVKLSVDASYSLVSESTVSQDKRIYGVYSLLEGDAYELFSEDGDQQKYTVDSDKYTSFLADIKDTGLQRGRCNSLGEGMINVCNENGNIVAGDYICSSNTKGKGMRQDADYLANYTVAKALEDVTWGSGETEKIIACTYHCG